MSNSKWHAPGMKRVRLMAWLLFYRTPLNIPIEEWVERGVARRCRFSWEEYCALKQAHPEIWERYAMKREEAVKRGHFAPQPPHLRRWRREGAKRRAALKKARPRFSEWAAKQLLRQRSYKQQWRRHLVLNHLLIRLLEPYTPIASNPGPGKRARGSHLPK